MDQVEESEESHARQGLSATRSAHGTDKEAFNYVPKFEGLLAVEAFLSDDLPDHLKRRLCTICFLLWHVQIIHEEQQPVGWIRWSVDALLVLLELALHVTLNLHWSGGRREYHLTTFPASVHHEG